MKNLLYIGNKLSHKGKTQTTIETLSKHLSNEGFKVISVSRFSNKLIRLLHMLLTICKYSKQTDYVLIDTYSTQNFYYAYLCSLLCRFLKLEYIPVLHGGNLPNRLKTSPRLSKTLFKNAYKNIAPSLYTKLNFEKLGYHNIDCIPNSIDLKNYQFKKREIGNCIKLLWVRSFSEIYNPLLAIKVFKALKDQNINAELCMVGPDNDGSLEKAKQLSNELNIDVQFTGKLSKKEWVKLSNHYNIFINTTNLDNMPVSVIEAMALGLPIISTNVGGIPFLIKNEEDGLLIKPNDTNAFINAIKKLKKEPEFVAKIVRNARGKAEKLDWNEVKCKWFNVLQ